MRIDFIRNVPVQHTVLRGYPGQVLQDYLDKKDQNYYLAKRIEGWQVVFEFTIEMEVWTLQEILAREG